MAIPSKCKCKQPAALWTFLRGYAKAKTIGISRETKGLWECRSPLTPAAVGRLAAKYDLKFKVESSRKRVFSDAEYEQQNNAATIVNSLDGCDLILGVKQPPLEQILPSTAYLFFSHTHKGQVPNMPLLKRICDLKSSLYDYELLTDPSTGRRLVAFGKYAGYSGMIMALHGLGLALLARGIKTPFLNVPQTQCFVDVESARQWISKLRIGPIDCGGVPLVFVFTGNGRVSQGAQEIFQCLPHEMVAVDELPALMTNFKRDRVYGCVVGAKDYAVNREGGHFDRQEYYAHPERYESRFHELILPYTSVLINGIYWEPRFPRILEASHLALAKNLVSIADISCDLGGSIGFTSHASTIDAPFWDFHGIQMMTIDNLPAQLPRDASEYFSSRLEPLVPALAGLESNAIVTESKIVCRGKVVAKFAPLLNQQMATVGRSSSDSGSSSGSSSSNSRSSSSSNNSNDINQTSNNHSNNQTNKSRKRALILGSGHVSGPVIEYLRAADIDVSVASSDAAKPDVIRLDVTAAADCERLDQLVQSHDIVISLVSAHLHADIAKVCIRHRRPLVTASYVSPEMQALDAAAQSARVLLLNEIGLDPGLDHLTAMALIRDAHSCGLAVESLVSWCGGLPAPEDSSNILGYKFSWSPRGVLLAAQNDARFLRDGQIVEVKGSDLLLSAQRVDLAPGFAFEGAANRDALKYRDLYGIPECRTMFRGTLRYAGFSELLNQFRLLGLLRQDVQAENGSLEWRRYLHEQTGLAEVTEQSLMSRLGLTVHQAGRLFHALNWLGLLRPGCRLSRQTPFDSFCAVLQGKLAYSPGERDLVFLRHNFIFSDPRTGRKQHRTATICEYGHVGGFSAMARTVGYPVAVAARLILQEGTFQSLVGVHGPLLPQFSQILTELVDKKCIRVAIKTEDDCN